MRLTRDKISEKYEQFKGVFEPRIPNGFYEIILRGELTYPLTEYESSWFTSMYMKKDKQTDVFIKDLLNTYKPTNNLDDLISMYYKLQNVINSFEGQYCEKYCILPQEFTLYIVTEDKINMTASGQEYKPITRPFHLFITYNNKGKHFKVTK